MNEKKFFFILFFWKTLLFKLWNKKILFNNLSVNVFGIERFSFWNKNGFRFVSLHEDANYVWNWSLNKFRKRIFYLVSSSILKFVLGCHVKTKYHINRCAFPCHKRIILPLVHGVLSRSAFSFCTIVYAVLTNAFVMNVRCCCHPCIGRYWRY